MALVADLFAAYPCRTPMVPVQTSRGCAYGQCRYCSYPLAEPGYVEANLTATLEPAVALAVHLRGAVVIKDSYVLPKRMQDIARMVAGRVPWAACTRLPDAARPGLIEEAARGGLHTLELGLETVDEKLFRIIGKRQSSDELLAACADGETAGVHLVLNIIYGLPGQSEQSARASKAFLERRVTARFPELRFKVEKNALEVERSTPFAERPEAYGLVLRRTWPFSAVIDHELPAWVLPLLEEAA